MYLEGDSHEYGIKKENVIVDEEEFALAEQEAAKSEYVYTHHFKRPLNTRQDLY